MLTRNKEIERRHKDGRDFSMLLPPAAVLERERRQGEEAAERLRADVAPQDCAHTGATIDAEAVRAAEAGRAPAGVRGAEASREVVASKVRNPSQIERDRREEAAIKARSLLRAAEAGLGRSLPLPSSLPPPTPQRATGQAASAAWPSAAWQLPEWRAALVAVARRLGGACSECHAAVVRPLTIRLPLPRRLQSAACRLSAHTLTRAQPACHSD